MTRVFILTVEVADLSDKKIDGKLEIVKNSLEEVLTAKEDLQAYFGYNKLEIVSIKEIWITEKSTESVNITV